MSLKIGDSAPDFTLVTLGTDGPETFTLSEAIGEKNIVLLFVPMAFTGVCTEQLCEVTAGSKAFEDLDARVLSISGDGPFAQQAWAEKEGIKLQQLSDYEHTVAKAYGIAYESFLPEANLIMGGVPKRSAFVIDKDGKIQHIDIKEHPKDVPAVADIQSVLSQL